MAAYSDILAAQRRSAASSYGQDTDGTPGMSGDFLILFCDFWHGAAQEAQGLISPAIAQIDMQLQNLKAWRDDFGVSSVGPEVRQVWDTAALLVSYIDPLSQPGPIDNALKAIHDAAGSALDGVKGAIDAVGHAAEMAAWIVGGLLVLYVYMKGRE